MTAPLSDERLAALRERWERGDAVGWSDAIDTIGEAVQTIAVLLDEVERLRAENDGLRGECKRIAANVLEGARAGSADVIDSLKAEVERLRAERRWIPVGERLPDNSDTVLVIVEWVSQGWNEFKRYREVLAGCWMEGRWEVRDWGVGLDVVAWWPAPALPVEDGWSWRYR